MIRRTSNNSNSIFLKVDHSLLFPNLKLKDVHTRFIETRRRLCLWFRWYSQGLRPLDDWKSNRQGRHQDWSIRRLTRITHCGGNFSTGRPCNRFLKFIQRQGSVHFHFPFPSVYFPPFIIQCNPRPILCSIAASMWCVVLGLRLRPGSSPSAMPRSTYGSRNDLAFLGPTNLHLCI